MRLVILSVKHPNDLQNKVAAIKAVRSLTGLGLKEAKDLVERITPSHNETIQVPSTHLDPTYTSDVESLRSSGLTVQLTKNDSPARKAIGAEISKVITYATMSGNYDISKALLSVMETYCPDPVATIDENGELQIEE